VVALARELQMDSAVRDSLGIHPLADACVAQQLGDPVLEHAGADPLLAILAAAGFEDDGLDPLQLEQTSERQTGGTGTDNADLRSHSTVCSKTWKALFAAGTPQ